MRKGEALALTWRTSTSRQAITRVKDNNLYVKSTKTGIARSINMDNGAMAVRILKKKQKQDYLKLGFYYAAYKAT